MIRQIIHIDEDKCNGCGLCAEACHEGAIEIIDGKAKLVRENFCDGFGDCLPNCPTGAITFEEREAPAYDKAAVKVSQEKAEQEKAEQEKAEQEKTGQKLVMMVKVGQKQAIQHMNRKEHSMEENENKTDKDRATAGTEQKTDKEAQRITPEFFKGTEVERSQEGFKGTKVERIQEGRGSVTGAGQGCPGSRFMQLRDAIESAEEKNVGGGAAFARPASRLKQWPCQIKLLPTQAPFYDGARLLIAADCTAYAYANMHEDFMKGKVTMIGCPKLDNIDYSVKLTEIIRDNKIKNVTIVRMDVPCCGGLQRAVETALRNSGKFIPWQVVTISRDGRILDLT